MPATYGVGDDGGVGVTKMGFGVDVVDRCRGAEFGGLAGCHLTNLEPNGSITGVSFTPASQRTV